MNCEQLDLMGFVQNLIKFFSSERSYVDKSTRRRVENFEKSSKISLDFKARAHNRLLEITNNFSKTIMDSCSGIDEICNKVRECLDDAHQMGLYEPAFSCPLIPFQSNSMYVDICFKTFLKLLVMFLQCTWQQISKTVIFI